MEMREQDGRARHFQSDQANMMVGRQAQSLHSPFVPTLPTVSSYSTPGHRSLSVHCQLASHSPFLHNGKVILLSLPICLEPRSKSLQLHHSCSPCIANQDDRLLPRNHIPLDMVSIKAIITQQGAERDNRWALKSDSLSDQVDSYFFYANVKFLLLSLPSHLSPTV